MPIPSYPDNLSSKHNFQFTFTVAQSSVLFLVAFLLVDPCSKHWVLVTQSCNCSPGVCGHSRISKFLEGKAAFTPFCNLGAGHSSCLVNIRWTRGVLSPSERYLYFSWRSSRKQESWRLVSPPGLFPPQIVPAPAQHHGISSELFGMGSRASRPAVACRYVEPFGVPSSAPSQAPSPCLLPTNTELCSTPGIRIESPPPALLSSPDQAFSTGAFEGYSRFKVKQTQIVEEPSMTFVCFCEFMVPKHY
ncbi:uncharacterized protein LOC124098694 [Marmota monax]|uniref:uncharacterized protein LOC124098694 n=1 Tax=Marmota monax TaxID=9995 RepID=UPI001EB0003A|nr:uncharacterized protein LOC124098694 [Marmota monax]